MSRGHTVCATDGCPELAGPGRNRCPAHDPGPWAGSTRSARLPANWRTTLRPFVLERDGYRCTVLVDGAPVRSCLMFAISAQGLDITTVEGIGNDPAQMSPVQQAFAECHALQCGFCTPGFITTITAFLEDNPDPSEEEARECVSGNLCRCTGYQNIVKAVLRAAEIRRDGAASSSSASSSPAPSSTEAGGAL